MSFTMRKGMDKGTGKGYRNVVGSDRRVHSMSARGIRQPQRITTLLSIRNLCMNPETYKLRRQVIDIIYDAKKIVPNLPRIEVRITEDEEKVLATTRMDNHNVIWVTKKALKESPNDLRLIIKHEILHTIFGVRHKKSGIMKPIIQRGWSRTKIDSEFMKEVKKSKVKL